MVFCKIFHSYRICLAVLLQLLCTCFLFAQKLDSNFEGGNAMLLNTGPNNYVEIQSELKPGDTRNIVFFTRIYDLDPTIPLKLKVNAQYKSPYVFYSYDNIQWQRSPRIASGVYFVPLTSESVYVAHFVPYLFSRSNNLMDSLNAINLDHTRISTLTISEGGLPVKMAYITDSSISDENKKLIWVIGRHHAFEHPANYVTEGLLRFFTSQDPLAQRIRKEAIINVVPMMDVDKAFEGGTGKDQLPVDFNRDWIAPDHESHWSAVREVKKLIEQQTNSNELVLYIDSHSVFPGGNANFHYILRDEDQLKNSQFFIESTVHNGGVWYERSIWEVSDPAISKDYFPVFYYMTKDLLSVTTETGFEMAPDNEFWTVQKLLKQGKAMGAACSDYVSGLTKSEEIIIDNTDENVITEGNWESSIHLPGFIGDDYLFAMPGSDATFTFEGKAPEKSVYGLGVHYTSNNQRASDVKYRLEYSLGTKTYSVDQRTLGNKWLMLDTLNLEKDELFRITIEAKGEDGYVIADAIRIYPIDNCDVPNSNDSPEVVNFIFKCYPNPSNGNILLKIENIEQYKDLQYRLYNSSGYIMVDNMKIKKATNLIYISSPGVYILQVYSNDNPFIANEKIIVY